MGKGTSLLSLLQSSLLEVWTPLFGLVLDLPPQSAAAAALCRGLLFESMLSVSVTRVHILT